MLLHLFGWYRPPPHVMHLGWRCKPSHEIQKAYAGASLLEHIFKEKEEVLANTWLWGPQHTLVCRPELEFDLKYLYDTPRRMQRNWWEDKLRTAWNEKRRAQVCRRL